MTILQLAPHNAFTTLLSGRPILMSASRHVSADLEVSAIAMAEHGFSEYEVWQEAFDQRTISPYFWQLVDREWFISIVDRCERRL